MCIGRVYLILIASFCVCLCSLNGDLFAGEAGKVGADGRDAPPTAEKLEQLKKDVEGDATISMEDRKRLLGFYGDALAALGQAKSHALKYEKDVKFAKTASDDLKKLQDDLALPAAGIAEPSELADGWKVDRVVQKAREFEMSLSSAEGRVERLMALLGETEKRPEQIKGLLSEGAKKLKAVESDLSGAPPEGYGPKVVEAYRLALLAKRYELEAEQRRLNQESAINGPFLSLKRAELELEERRVREEKKKVGAWQAYLQKRQEEAADAAIKEGRDLVSRTKGLPELVGTLAGRVRDYATAHQGLIGEHPGLKASVASRGAELSEIRKDHERMRERLESKRSATGLVAALRTIRRSLPDRREFRDGWRKREEEMSRLTGAQDELELRRRELPGLSERIGRISEGLTEAQLIRINMGELARPNEVLTAYRKQLGELQASYGDRIKLLTELDATENDIVVESEQFAELIDRHLLWIRSADPISATTFGRAWKSLGWLFSPSHWGGVLEDVRDQAGREPVTWVCGVLGVALLLAFRRRGRRSIIEISQRVGSIRTDSYWLTIRALIWTLVRAMGWPMLLLFVGWRMLGALYVEDFSRGVGAGLMVAGGIWMTVGLIRELCAENGLADRHFRWREEPRVLLRAFSARFLVFVTPLSVIAVVGLYAEDSEHDVGLGRLAFMGVMVVMAWLLLRTFRPSGKMMARVLAKQPGGWLNRLRYLWYALLIGLPLVFGVLAGFGYLYASLQLFNQLEQTFWMIIGLMLVHEMLTRWLFMTHRRLAYEEAVQKREEKRKEKEGEGVSVEDGESAIVLDESEVSLAQISEQTRSLVRVVVAATFLVGLYVIWASILPALGMLDQVTLWDNSVEIDGKTVNEPTTLASIGLAFLVIVVTVLASRNLPALLEMILLSRLPLDAGARYAYSTLLRYAVSILGVIVAFSVIGVSWSKLQWLVAAMSVGLGFGLQEIVANFVSGLIILFERPCRVGDTVTVGSTSGVVTRIRIRATTITDFDRRELIVPNKEFVTGQLINWSLSDPILRICIPVGIAYGSDTVEAERLLLKVANESPLVLDEPKPGAYFTGFGASSLDFELRAFISDVEHRVQTRHELHRRIDEAFREAGIEISFPQRDVHLDTSSPLRVQMVEDSEGK